LAKEIARLRQEARARILGKLNPAQKEKAEKMLGDAFQFSEAGSKVPIPKKVVK